MKNVQNGCEKNIHNSLRNIRKNDEQQFSFDSAEIGQENGTEIWFSL